MPATPASPHAEDDEAARAERDDVERRRCWLAKLPAAYAPKHRPRYVLLNLDNTAASLVMSRFLFRGVEGARCPHDLRLNFEALTAHLCGTSTSALVVHQLATYGKTNPSIAQALEKFGWTLKPTGNDDNALQTELLTQLQKGAATANGKTLVLAMGGGSFGSGNTSAYHEIISKFLVEGWHVEIHAWLRALSDGYLRLQSEYPGRVVVKPLDDVIRDIVFVKRKGQSPTTAAKHVCSVLNQDDVPLKVVTSPLSDTASTASLSSTNCSDESPRAAIVSSIQTCVHSVPPATSPNASWIKATMQGQQKLRATTPTSNSPPVPARSNASSATANAHGDHAPLPTSISHDDTSHGADVHVSFRPDALAAGVSLDVVGAAAAADAGPDLGAAGRPRDAAVRLAADDGADATDAGARTEAVAVCRIRVPAAERVALPVRRHLGTLAPSPPTDQATNAREQLSDVLSELYAWDSIVEDDFALPAGDPKRDEDKTEDAFEQIIHAASGDASDIVLSLAAQLLHKHFFRFPHVQLNVVDVLLKLCGPKRSQAVRIHTLRALLQIVKTPPASAAASTPTSAAAIARKNTRMWLERIDQAVQHMLDTEKSSVILRQVTPLRQALLERLAPEGEQSKPQPADADQSEHASPSERTRKKPRDDQDVAPEDAAAERDPKKAKRDDDVSYQSGARESNIVQLNREPSNGEDSWKKQAQQTPNGRVVESEGRRRNINAFSPRNCPPCPYLFLGSVPRHTPSSEIVEYLSSVWPEIDNMSVQIKQPDYNATAYAFVSMPTIEHAREAIHYVAANKFRGRTFLNANFARGPPVDTVLFVERTGENVNMEDKGAVRDFDFTKCDPEVWDVLCQQLERFGPLSFAENGCVRFRSVEHAKAAIRRQLFTVKGYEIYPVYDTKEQFAIDSTRRGSNAHNKQGFALKSGRLGDADFRGSKSHRYKEDDDPMDGGRREHDRVASLKYGDRSGSARSRSPPRSDRESARGRSRSRSPKTRSGGGRFDVPMGGPPKDRRPPHSRSRSPINLAKQLPREGGYGTPSDKENRREYRGKYGRRSPSPGDARIRDSPGPVDELRGRPRDREGPWMGPRSTEDRRGPRDDGRGRGGFHRGASPSPSSSSRRSRKDDADHRDYRRGGEDGRPSYRREEPLQEERGRMPPPGVLNLPRSHSRSPPRFGKYSSGSSKSRPRSRSRSPHQDVRMGGGSSQRPSGYRGRDNQVPEERPAFQPERPRYADDRSIAEVARDEQQERQRFFQQQQQGRRDFHDGDLSRYGGGRGGRGGGRGGRGGRGDRSYHDQSSFRGGGRNGAMYRQEIPPQQRRSQSPLPPATSQRSSSPPPQSRRRSPSPQQQRESYGRERRGEFAPRGRESGYSPPPSPLLQNSFGASNPGAAEQSDRHEFEPDADDREGRHERRHHSRRDRSREDKSHRSHRDRREKRSSRAERSLTPSPLRQDHASASSGRKSNGPSPRGSFSRRNDGDNQTEEASGKDKQPRSKNEDESEPQQKEMKNGGARLARDELFAGMDDLTVDYEEDDE
ncbi:unnamed protein product [Phytophthora lilii]|uniref:Unnamed protein product n=1 Tax=Phytophthora lilii TaxID=2077276 RepID=A0A9W6UAG9_9STRA|nr:unnamed protein product [Phytophthora lilii]